MTFGRHAMLDLLPIVDAALRGDALGTRSLVQDWVERGSSWTEAPQPVSDDPRVLAVAASLVEMFAERAGQPSPLWTAGVAALAEPLYLVRSAQRMPRLKELCVREGPAPLRRRGILAPPGYLSFV